MHSEEDKPPFDQLDDLLYEEPSKTDQQISALEKQLEYERDARMEDRFVFIVIIVLLLDIVFFSVMPTFGGPLALLILELIILIPLARKMGMEELAAIFHGVVSRMAGRANDADD